MAKKRTPTREFETWARLHGRERVVALIALPELVRTGWQPLDDKGNPLTISFDEDGDVVADDYGRPILTEGEIPSFDTDGNPVTDAPDPGAAGGTAAPSSSGSVAPSSPAGAKGGGKAPASTVKTAGGDA